ncbi:threonine--tRNA ligase, partial [Candidatus Woesebacteria bacterium]|nr:threonine--tRNA ligase [Candidatus Woesebacteria bacterium]
MSNNQQSNQEEKARIKLKLEHLRHSASHLLAAAVMELHPDAQLTIGPATDEGFYYDVAFAEPFSDSELSVIEAKMHEIVKDWSGFEKKEVSPEEAREHFAGNRYKLELIEEIAAKGEQVTLYTSGTFTDLCRGGHVEDPADVLKYFKLLSVAGAYWRGSEKNAMLTRIYGTAFFSQAELEEHIQQREEAKLRDHRKLGAELDLF